MTLAYIGLGSNLENPEIQISKALSALEILPDTEFICNSSLYRSKPLGPQEQPDFINAVVKLDTTLPPLTLLDNLQSIEKQQGRVRDKEIWGQRTIDLDLLLYGEEQINLENLIIPHAEMHKRNFVLYPLYEISSNLVIPGKGAISELLDNLSLEGIEKIEQK